MASHCFRTEKALLAELDDILSVRCDSPGLIDQALRSFLRFTSTYREEYLSSEFELTRCSCKLLDSSLFRDNEDYVRRQIVYGLLQEDSGNVLHVITAFLFVDGRRKDDTFELMGQEGCFPRLVELIRSCRDDDGWLHRRLLELLYEMSRIQRIRAGDLCCVDDAFVAYLFQIIEGLSDDVNDPYHYPVIRVLLVLNEQYMVCAHGPGHGEPGGALLTNRVIKIISLHGSAYKTFGENIILLLNRETEMSLQLLTLKLLYLLFTTHATHEYFYTNDLRVLVDVMIRNLLDLPDEAESLRHTYLRVLYPLLAHTQLRHPPHYKREEILKLLNVLSVVPSAHFQPLDETTARLVTRCRKVPWLKEQEILSHGPLGISHGSAAQSTLSVTEVAGTTEKPGTMMPSRTDRRQMDDERARANGVVIGGEGGYQQQLSGTNGSNGNGRGHGQQFAHGHWGLNGKSPSEDIEPSRLNVS